jgi:GAF domain-containing protein
MRGQYGELLAPEYHESPAMDALVTVKDDTGPLAARQAEADVRPRLWRAACGDPELEPLVEGVLSELVNHSGARYGLLALDQGDRLLVEGEYWAEDNRTVVGQHAPLKLEDDLPHMAINYALRVQEPVVLEDARNSTFARDPYVEKEEVRSLLCMPLTRGQKVFGLLYLENDLTPGAFSAERARQIQSLTPELVTWLEAALRRREQAERLVRLERREHDAMARVRELSEMLGRERQVASSMLQMMLPAEFAEEFRRTGAVAERQVDEFTVCAVVVEPPQPRAAGQERLETRDLEDIHRIVEEGLTSCGAEKLTRGVTRFLVCACAAVERDRRATSAVAAALRVVRQVRERNQLTGRNWTIRVGVHTGRATLALLGSHVREFHCTGPAPDVAWEVAQSATGMTVTVTEATAVRLRKGMKLTERGRVAGKGEPSSPLFVVTEERGTP